MASFWDKLVSFYKRGNVVSRLIMVNAGVFLLVRIFFGILGLFHVDDKLWMDWLLVPAGFSELLNRPWTVLTYLFVHYNLMHLLMNMVWLYVFGLFLQRWFSSSQLIAHYVLGGMTGAVLFIVGNQMLVSSGDASSQAPLIGASASVMAICVAAAVYRPNEPISLFLVGTLKLKYLALIMIGLDLLGFNPDSMGVAFAHLGGGLYGLTAGLMAKRGMNMVGWFDRLVYRYSLNTSIFNSNKQKGPRMKVKYKRSRKETTNRTVDVDQAYRNRKREDEGRLDAILDKIKQSGYDSLSTDEKKQLFDMSNRSNQ